MPIWLRRLFYQAILSRRLIAVYDRYRQKSSSGEQGELAAERFLLKRGLTIIARRYKDKIGEIDLIAVDGRTVVFAEVKARSGDSIVDAIAAVDLAKQKQIVRTAKGYLKWHQLENCSVRFDVIAVLWKSDQNLPQIVHYANAFEATEDFQLF